MRFAILDGTRATAQPQARALCPGCHLPVLAKCGEVLTWHWAHVAALGCDWEPGGETEWHLNWKAAAPDDRQEVALNGHRADIVSPTGVVIELQHSHLSGINIRDRERAYGRMVWLFDARTARDKQNLELRRHPDQDPANLYRNITWYYAPAFTTQTSAVMFLDIGDDQLLWIGGWYNEQPRRGYGWLVTHDWFRRVIVNGPHLPATPKRNFPLTAERLERQIANPDAAEPAVLDWSKHSMGALRPCRICGFPALMRDDAGQPCHKVCAEYVHAGVL